MATPQQGYPPQAPPGYDPNQQEQYDPNQHEPSHPNAGAPGGPPAASAGGRKKRHYAGQAYDFGGGANSALGGQQQGGAYPPPPGAGYGQPGPQIGNQPSQPAPAYGSGPTSPAPGGTPAYGQQYGQQSAAVGGYQSPDPTYPTHGAPPGPPGVGGITQGMGNLAMGGQGQHQAQQFQGRPPMNQLYPTDLLNQPVNVSEIGLPPPPIILPPNVSKEALFQTCDANGNSPV